MAIPIIPRIYRGRLLFQVADVLFPTKLLALEPLPPLKESPLPERLLRHLEILRQLGEGDQRFILKLAESMALR